MSVDYWRRINFVNFHLHCWKKIWNMKFFWKKSRRYEVFRNIYGCLCCYLYKLHWKIQKWEIFPYFLQIKTFYWKFIIENFEIMKISIKKFNKWLLKSEKCQNFHENERIFKKFAKFCQYFRKITQYFWIFRTFFNISLNIFIFWTKFLN